MKSERYQHRGRAPGRAIATALSGWAAVSVLLAAGCPQNLTGDQGVVVVATSLSATNPWVSFRKPDAVAAGAAFEVRATGAVIAPEDEPSSYQIAGAVRDVTTAVDLSDGPAAFVVDDEAPIHNGARLRAITAGSGTVQFMGEREVHTEFDAEWKSFADHLTFEARPVAGGQMADPLWVALTTEPDDVEPPPVLRLAGALPPPLPYELVLVPDATVRLSLALFGAGGEELFWSADGPLVAASSHQDVDIAPAPRATFTVTLADTALDDDPRTVALSWWGTPLFEASFSAVRPSAIADIGIGLLHQRNTDLFALIATVTDDHGRRVLGAPLSWDLPAKFADVTAEHFPPDSALAFYDRGDFRVLQMAGNYPINGATYDFIARVPGTDVAATLSYEMPGKPRRSPWNAPDPAKADPTAVLTDLGPGCRALHRVPDAAPPWSIAAVLAVLAGLRRPRGKKKRGPRGPRSW